MGGAPIDNDDHCQKMTTEARTAGANGYFFFAKLTFQSVSDGCPFEELPHDKTACQSGPWVIKLGNKDDIIERDSSFLICTACRKEVECKI